MTFGLSPAIGWTSRRLPCRGRPARERCGASPGRRPGPGCPAGRHSRTLSQSNLLYLYFVQSTHFVGWKCGGGGRLVMDALWRQFGRAVRPHYSQLDQAQITHWAAADRGAGNPAISTLSPPRPPHQAEIWENWTYVDRWGLLGNCENLLFLSYCYIRKLMLHARSKPYWQGTTGLSRG